VPALLSESPSESSVRVMILSSPADASCRTARSCLLSESCSLSESFSLSESLHPSLSIWQVARDAACGAKRLACAQVGV
jgi:hypothetical protein